MDVLHSGDLHRSCLGLSWGSWELVGRLWESLVAHPVAQPHDYGRDSLAALRGRGEHRFAMDGLLMGLAKGPLRHGLAEAGWALLPCTRSRQGMAGLQDCPFWDFPEIKMMIGVGGLRLVSFDQSDEGSPPPFWGIFLVSTFGESSWSRTHGLRSCRRGRACRLQRIGRHGHQAWWQHSRPRCGSIFIDVTDAWMMPGVSIKLMFTSGRSTSWHNIVLTDGIVVAALINGSGQPTSTFT